MPRSQKPRKPHNWRKTARQDLRRPPHIHQAYQTFLPIYDLLDEISRGEVDAVDGKPIMRIWGGDHCEVCPAIEGWISCWDRIVSGERLQIDLDPLRQLHRALISGELLTLDQVEAARRVTDQCHAAYCALPREVILSHSRTEQIAVELESLGISPSA